MLQTGAGEGAADPFAFPDSPAFGTPTRTHLLHGKASPSNNKPTQLINKVLTSPGASEPAHSGSDPDEPPARRHVRAHGVRTRSQPLATDANATGTKASTIGAAVTATTAAATTAVGGPSAAVQGDVFTQAVQQQAAGATQPARRPPKGSSTPQKQQPPQPAPPPLQQLQAREEQKQQAAAGTPPRADPATGRATRRTGSQPPKGPVPAVVAAAAAAAAASALNLAVGGRRGSSPAPMELDQACDLGPVGRAGAQPASQPLSTFRSASPMPQVAKSGKAAARPPAPVMRRVNSAPSSPARAAGVRAGLLLPPGMAGPAAGEGARVAVIGSAPADIAVEPEAGTGTGRVRFGPNVAFAPGKAADDASGAPLKVAGSNAAAAAAARAGAATGQAGACGRLRDVGLDQLPDDTPIVVEAEQPGGQVTRITITQAQLKQLMGQRGLAALGIRGQGGAQAAAAAAAQSVMEVWLGLGIALLYC